MKNLEVIEDFVGISRKGFAPKGEYCDKCSYFRLEDAAICSFFGSLLFSEKDKTPCGITFDRYKKCLDCKLQTDEKVIKQATELGISTEELVQTMKDAIVITLIENLKEQQQ